ncbi:AAA family ATPase [Thermocrinis minervae]|uniref:MoxR-like ATPase n=1 Tax=Thermocrinis minervae TaxID=381751 RepID=A0A1M6QDL0_9AQUI|nr:MoxR family ATPase [Thermocrinis minervae]SHK18281.1 MoxR-like ATPase [Thermocrinis minervae]
MNISEVLRAVSSVLKGKEEVVFLSLACFLSGGHLLIEDVPGVGKTTLALALSRVLGLSFARIQFTSDLLPSDITGVNVYDQQKRSFVFKPGPIFHQTVLADEINRASPKTQSALLEAMAEKKITLDGTTYELPFPFFVIATQNPAEQYGTYPLPESQLDRFSMRISVGYPDRDVEVQIVKGENPLEVVNNLRPLVSLQEIVNTLQQVKRVYISEEVAGFIVDMVRKTRSHPDIILGASTRGAIHLASCAKAVAYMRERDYVVPEDVIDVAPYVLSHRLIVREGIDSFALVKDIVRSVKVP